MGVLLSKLTDTVNDCDLNTTPATKTPRNKFFKKINIDPRSPTFGSDFDRTPVTIRVPANNANNTPNTPISHK